MNIYSLLQDSKTEKYMTIKHKKEHELLNSDPAEHKMQPSSVWSARTLLFILAGGFLGAAIKSGILGVALLAASGYYISRDGISNLPIKILTIGAIIGILLGGIIGLIQGGAVAFIASKVFGCSSKCCGSVCNKE